MHAIETFEDGSASFFSARELPWHRLGTITENVLTAEEAIKVAQQDWLVEKVPVFAQLADGTKVPVEGKFATVRNHAKAGISALGIVGNQYVPVQNHEAFEVLDLIRDDSGAIYETAGSIFNGKRVFITMKLPKTMVFEKDKAEADRVELYLLAMNSHDASTAFTLVITPIRVVCKNTLSAALKDYHRVVHLKHTRNVKNRVQEAREALGLTFAYVDEFEKQVQALINADMKKPEFTQFAQKLFPVKGTSQKQETRVEKVHETLMALWEAPTQGNIKGTRWGAYNAVVEYVDYAMGVRLTAGKGKATDAQTVRAIRTMTGSADSIKNKAMKLLSK